MGETVYIETSILGYLTARSTKNLILAGNIEMTRDWWELRRSAFTLYISQVVLSEATQGDAEMATQRLLSCCAFNLHKQHFPCFLLFFPI